MSLPGICKLLRRLGVTYKRGRAHLHSPDLLYNKKMAYIRSLHELNRTDPERYVLLYEDEMTYYRRAIVQQGWAGRGNSGAIKVKEAGSLQLDQAHCGLPGCAYGAAHQSAEKYLSGYRDGSLLPLCGAALSHSRENFCGLGQLVRAFPSICVGVSSQELPADPPGAVAYLRSLDQSDGEGLVEALPNTALPSSLR
jgi:hypothetical protein